MTESYIESQTRAKIAAEAEAFSARHDIELKVSNFDDYMDRLERMNITSVAAGLALKSSGGDLDAAFASFTTPVEVPPAESLGADPSVEMWRSSSPSITGLAVQSTFEI